MECNAGECGMDAMDTTPLHQVSCDPCSNSLVVKFMRRTHAINTWHVFDLSWDYNYYRQCQAVAAIHHALP